MTEFNSDFAESLIDAALSFGAGSAEVYFGKKTETEIIVSECRAETANVRVDSGFAIRAVRDGKMVFASSSHTDRKEAVDLVRDAVKRMDLHSPDDFNVIPDRLDVDVTGVDEPFDETIERLPLDRKIEKAIQIEKAAKAFDPRVVGFGWLQYGDSVQDYCVCNSNGIRAHSRGTLAYAFAYAIAAADGCVQTGTIEDAAGYFDKLDPDLLGQRVARFAVRMLGSGEIHTGEYSLVLPPETSSSFISALADMFSADRVQKGKSPLAGRMGDVIASEKVTIVDDGVLPGGLATSPYDAEGVPATRKVLVRGGVLHGLLYDSYTARKDHTKSTGNSSRANYHSQPAITPSNFFVEPGNMTPGKILDYVGDGLYITELSGLHAGINPTTADFSVPAKAIVISGGELAHPVANITISGNLLSFFGNVAAVANDLAWVPSLGMIGAPTICVADIKVTGKN